MDFQPPIPLLQDIEHHLEQNNVIVGREQPLHDASDRGPQHDETPYRRQDLVELEATVNAQQQYQKEIIDKFIQEDQAIEKKKEQSKENLIQKCRGSYVSILTKNGMVIQDVQLDCLVSHCDTFLTLVRSDRWWASLIETEYSFSLEQFHMESVKEFLNVIEEKCKPMHQRSKCMEELVGTDHIIECCHIAHFLQAKEILDDIVTVIKSSIDSDNCTSICVLADELQIPSLLQASMKYVMERLDNIQENKELWEDIPIPLRNQIATLKHAAESSIVGRGQTKEVIFSSGDEFLAIFHDTLTGMKERLKDAKQRQKEIIQERLRHGVGGFYDDDDDDDSGVRERTTNETLGRFSKRFVEEKNVYGGSVKECRHQNSKTGGTNKDVTGIL
jgi:hypothetical protein